jgi:6,7-dimethyl-8-ribityllumazine synthase
MQNSDKGEAAELDGAGLTIGIVRARFNNHITERLAAVCIAELQALGVRSKEIRHITVPGALEVPLALKLLAEEGDCDALIAIGCVIRGETYHFELVADQSGAGVMRVSLDHSLPIANVILTVDTLAQAEARIEEKGRDAARVAVELANLTEDLS